MSSYRYKNDWRKKEMGKNKQISHAEFQILLGTFCPLTSWSVTLLIGGMCLIISQKKYGMKREERRVTFSKGT